MKTDLSRNDSIPTTSPAPAQGFDSDVATVARGAAWQEMGGRFQAQRRWLPRGRHAAIYLWPAVALFIILLALWHAYAGNLGDSQLLPTPAEVWQALVARRDLLWVNTLVTLQETAVGFAAALAAGVLLGTIIDFSPWLRRALYPLLVTSQTIPIITLAPLLVLWFGFGLLSKSIVILLWCFFPIVVALVDGLRATEPDLVKLYRSFGAGKMRIFWSVRLPGALPSLFSGIRIAITYSVVGAIFGEYVGAARGLGIFLQTAKNSYRTDLVFGMIAVTAALSLLLYGLVVLVEWLAIPWARQPAGFPFDAAHDSAMGG